MRVVLDTNVLVSAYAFPGGTPEDVLRMAVDRRFENVTTPPLLAELARVLQDKLDWDPRRTEVTLLQVVRFSLLAEPTIRIDIVAEDPTDNRVLEAADASAAAYIVSGDHHLLELGRFGAAAIVTPAQFISVVRPR